MPDTDDIRQKAVAAAARLLVKLLDPEPTEPVQVEVTVTNGRLDIQVQVRTHRQQGASREQPFVARLTGIDRRILTAATHEEQTMTRLAHLADHDADSYFRARVRRLLSLGLLASEFGGYKLP